MAFNKATVMGPTLAGTLIYLFICIIGNGSGGVQATHFRGGTISWKPSDSFSLTYKEIIFTFKLGWRLSRIGCDDKSITSGTLVGEDARWFCMYGCKGVVASTREKCTEFNHGDDWMTGSNTFKYVFDSDGPIEISYMECCWLTDLVVGAGGEWALTTTINLGIRSDTGGPNSSPVTAMAPMVTLRAGVPDVIDMAVRDSDGDKITCRLGRHVGECGTICSLFSEFILDEENCLIRYNPKSNTTGKIPVAIMVEDHHRSNNGITMGKKTFSMTDALSSVPVQFLVILKMPPQNCSDKPLITSSIPASNPVKVRPGHNFTFTVTATPCDVTSRIEEFILIAPIGVRKSPTIFADDAYTTQITWTPTADQDGPNLICVRAISSNGVPSDQICITVDVPKATAFCSVVGGSHFITFDKASFDFHGMCSYRLVGTLPNAGPELSPFNITLSNEETPITHNGVKIGSVEAEALGNTVTIDSERNVFLDGLLVNLPIRMKSGLRVEKSGRGISVALSLSIRMYLDDATLSVQLPQSYAGKVQGLCGNYNGEPVDDSAVRGEVLLVTDENEFTTSLEEVAELNRCATELNKIDKLQDEPRSCSEENMNNAVDKCSILIEEDGGCFDKCHEFIDPKHFHDNCISVLCKSSDDYTALDVLIRAYADVCQREGITVCDWRSNLGITMECPPNAHYETCTTTIPATCADSISSISPTPSKSCIEGCICNKGYILSGSICVPESECGCIINDIYYPKGFTYRTEGCTQECVCGEGCREVAPCDGRANCERGTDGFYRCIEKHRTSATCKAITDPHYQTFDGTKFDSMGNCAYIMVRSKRNATKATAFTVVAVNEQSGESANASHVKEVHIHFGDGHTLILANGSKLILNDKEINPGSSIYGVDIRQVGRFVVADFNFGLVVRWDGIDMLRITAWSPLRYMVEGLCGDWDGNPANDFAVRPTDENLPDPGSFAESWRIEGYGTDGCYDHPGTVIVVPPCKDDDSLARYQEECRGLIDRKGAFQSCHDLIDPIDSYNNCIYDLCAMEGDLNFRERVFSSYADDCLEEQGSPLRWRDETTSGVCVDGVFSECMEQCQPTCSDPTAAQCLAKTPNQLGGNCVEGCMCQEGLLLSGSSCIPPEDCGCMVNGRYEKKGFSFAIADCTQTCVCEGPDNLVCSKTPDDCALGRDSCEQREDGYYQCVRKSRRRATCKAVTDPHHRTFDRKNFDAMGTCSYVMVRAKETSDVVPFRVVAVNEQPWPNRTVSHVKEAWIEVGNLRIGMLKGGVITINGRAALPGTNRSDVQIRKVGRFWVADFPFGLYVKWDGQDRLRISAWSVLRGQLEGLCGDFDDDESNDFMTPDGELVENVTTFVNSWKTDGFESPDQDESCQDPLFDDPLPPCPDPAEFQKHEATCSTIKDPNSKYAPCHGVESYEQYIQDCIFDLCAYNGNETYKEKIFSEYVERCKVEGVEIDEDWRAPENLMSIECPENSHAEGDADQCQPTCTDPDGSICREGGTMGTERVEGCVCNEGYIMSGLRCVEESECGCVGEDGTYFEQGFVYRTNDCSQECECLQNRLFACKSVEGCEEGYRCRFDEDGYKRCIVHVKRRATCKAVTDPHYRTFDGVNYDSMGSCAYIMARSKASAEVTPFRVVAVNEKPTNVKHIVSHVKEVYVHVGDDTTVTFKGANVTINDEAVLPGTTVDGIEIRRVGRFTVAEFPFGLVIKWDNIDRLRVMAWGRLKGMMEGLCGDFNEDPENDFMTPDGVLETEVNDFVNSWKVDGYGTEGCEDPPETQDSPCDSPDMLDRFKESCRVLVDPEGPLLPCQELRDPESAFNNCVFDLCAYDGDSEIRERIISSYTEDCRDEALADTEPPGDFRTPEEINAICGDNEHFSNCMNQCQPTCTDTDGSFCRATSTAVLAVCVDGCECDEGFIRSGVACVRQEDCGCQVEGRYVDRGYTYNNRNCTTQCVCLGKGELSCTESSGCEKGFRCRINDEGRRACIPHIRRRATCKAVTDPHYQTFDGRRYDSMGTCAYVMVRSKNGADVDESFRVIAVNEEPKPGLNVSHVKEVHIMVGKNLKVSFLPGPVIKINGDEVLPGTTVGRVQIRKVGRFTVAEFDFGLVVRWDGIDRLRVMAWARLKGQVEGLCGDFDDDPENDFTTPRGNQEEDLQKFVRSWRVREFSPQDCLELQPPDDILDDCVPSEQKITNCSILKDPEGPFKDCIRVVDPEPYYQNCIFDWCHVGGVNSTLVEQHIDEYSIDCLEQQISPNDTVVLCPDNSTPAAMEQCQPTCNDRDASDCKANSTLGEDLFPGCICNAGFLLGGNECIRPEECGCLIDKKYREKGYKYLNDGCDVLCECIGIGDIVCLPTDPCLLTERCTKVNERYQCTPHITNKATCKAITDPHYTTFDGRTFDSSGWCAYTMARNIPSSDAPQFQVIAMHERDATFKASSRVTSVVVDLGDLKVEIRRRPKHRVNINDVWYYPGSIVQGVFIRKVGLFTLVEFNFGLVIRWDHNDRLRVTVWDPLKGKVEGLCGRYNDDADDDFTMPDGEITNDMTEFVESWSVKDSSDRKCVHLQDDVSTDCADPEVRAEYEDQCNVLLDAEGPFANCHRVADPQPAYRACVNDLCMMSGDLDFKDRVLTSYVHDCLELQERPEPWRSDENLPVPCGRNSKFARFMHQCQPTCSDPDASLCKNKNPYLLGANVVEGCKCDSGYYLSIEKCVKIENCGCLVNGVYHAKGFKYRENECRRECVCKGQNVFECRDIADGCLDTERCKLAPGGYLQCFPGMRRRATCKAITDPHFTAFDGTKFDSQGVCSYIMTRSRAGAEVDAFTVIAVNEQPIEDRAVSNVKEVHVDYRGHRLVFFKGPRAELDGEEVSTGTKESGMKLEKSGRFLAAYFDFGLNIRWDGADRLHISAMQELRGQLEGVCGDFNGDRTNDLTHAISGEVVTDPEDFVHSWRVQGFNDGCPRAEADFLSAEPPTPYECGEEDIIQAAEACRVLINPQGAFKNCMRLSDAETAYANCLLDMCAFSGDKAMQDRAISDYYEDCREFGGEPEKDWRQQANLTEVQCPPHSHYESCMTQCQPTCVDLDTSDCNSNDMGENCVEGCEADKGYVVSGDEFVPLAKCGCTKNGRYHKNGDIFYTEGCATLCQCKAGIVTCRKTSCGREEECAINNKHRLDCVRIEKSTCQSWGSTYFDTFDGRNYNLTANCNYLVVKREIVRGDPSSRQEAFFLTVSITPSVAEEAVTEVKNVRIRFPARGLMILLKPDAQARIHGKNVQNWRSEDENLWINVDRRGSYTVVTTFFGLEVAFDGHHLRVTITKKFAGKVLGLCGNFNDDPDDDLTLEDDTPNQDVGRFSREHSGSACKSPRKLKPYTCSSEDSAKWGAANKCGAIVDPNSEFANCSKTLDAQKYFDKCLEDVCRAGGSSIVLAKALKVYAHECAAIDEFVCDWRRDYMLQIACPVNSHYVGCTAGCEDTCGLGEEECKYQKVEDCVCDEGYIRSQGSCVAKAACGGCLLNRKMVPKGFSYRPEKCSKLCTCVGNDVVECGPSDGCIARAKCGKDDSGFSQCLIKPRRKARCQAFGNGHLVTFDGSGFNTTATCALIMARSREDATIPKFAVKVDMQPARNSNLSRVAQVIVTADNLDMILAEGRTVMVNGRNVAIGSVLETVAIRKIGRDVAAVFDFGMTLRWDGRQNIRIEAKRPLAGQVEGLCGDFDEDESDDFRTPFGVVESDISVFVNSWKDQGSYEGCRLDKPRKSPCENLDELAEYKGYCETKYPGKSTSSAKCNLFEYCLFEMCATNGDRTYITGTIYSFHETCTEDYKATTDEEQAEEPEIEPPVIECAENSHYNACMSQCQGICSDQDAIVCLSNDDLKDGCVSGCQCDDGYMLDRETCVKASECGCVGKEGEYYPNQYDSFLEDCEQKCQCNNGSLTCKDASCYPGQFCGYKKDSYGCHWENECLYQNGGCDHVCAWTDQAVVCSCRDGYNLTSNGKTCEAVHAGCGLHKYNFSEWKSDTMQAWIEKLDSYMEAMRKGMETGTPVHVCKTVWTNWFDFDNPDGDGDIESMRRIRKHYSGSICSNPVAIDARLTDGRSAFASGMIIRIMSPIEGLHCYNSDQRAGEKCGDFQVRFLCLEELI